MQPQPPWGPPPMFTAPHAGYPAAQQPYPFMQPGMQMQTQSMQSMPPQMQLQQTMLMQSSFPVYPQHYPVPYAPSPYGYMQPYQQFAPSMQMSQPSMVYPPPLAVAQPPLPSNPPLPPPAPLPKEPEPSTIIDGKLVFEKPGRLHRAEKLVLILRGLPGSGKSRCVRLIKAMEAKFGASAPRVLSLDDYYAADEDDEVQPSGKRTKTVRQDDDKVADSYRESQLKVFQRTLSEGHFPFVIVDGVHSLVSHFENLWKAAKRVGFEVYIAELKCSVETAVERNVHGYDLASIEKMRERWEPVPAHMKSIDLKCVLELGDAVAPAVAKETSVTTKPRVLERPPSPPPHVSASLNRLLPKAPTNGASQPPPSSNSTPAVIEARPSPVNASKPQEKKPSWRDVESDEEDDKPKAVVEAKRKVKVTRSDSTVDAAAALLGIAQAYATKRVRWADTAGRPLYEIELIPNTAKRSLNENSESESDDDDVPATVVASAHHAQFLQRARDEHAVFRQFLIERRPLGKEVNE